MNKIFMLVVLFCGVLSLQAHNKIQEALNAEQAVVYFSKSPCKGCELVEEGWTEVSQQGDSKTKFVKIKKEQGGQDVIEEYQISGYPTFIFFKDGNEVGREKGGSEDFGPVLKSFMRKHFGGNGGMATKKAKVGQKRKAVEAEEEEDND